MSGDEQGTKFYRPEEVAEILQVPCDAVLRAIKNGELSAINLGARTFRVMDFQVDEYRQREA